jgi:hypothetical protein
LKEVETMPQKICVALGEVGQYPKQKAAGNAGDIVQAASNDHIYYYHVDSCMAVALYPEAKISGKVECVGIHISMRGPKDEWKDPVGSAAYYIKKLEQLAPDAKWKYAAFVGGGNDWSKAACTFVKEMKIQNASFVNHGETTDVWAATNGEIKLTPYKSTLCLAPGLVVTKSINAKQKNGYDGHCDPQYL